MARSRPYNEALIQALRDPVEAAEYLNAALEDGDQAAFMLALRNVADAQGGMSQIAKLSSLNRESLYRMLSGNGNPRVSSLNALLHAMGMRLAVETTDLAGNG